MNADAGDVEIGKPEQGGESIQAWFTTFKKIVIVGPDRTCKSFVSSIGTENSQHQRKYLNGSLKFFRGMTSSAPKSINSCVSFTNRERTIRYTDCDNMRIFLMMVRWPFYPKWLLQRLCTSDIYFVKNMILRRIAVRMEFRLLFPFSRFLH